MKTDHRSCSSQMLYPTITLVLFTRGRCCCNNGLYFAYIWLVNSCTRCHLTHATTCCVTRRRHGNTFMGGIACTTNELIGEGRTNRTHTITIHLNMCKSWTCMYTCANLTVTSLNEDKLWAPALQQRWLHTLSRVQIYIYRLCGLFASLSCYYNHRGF